MTTLFIIFLSIANIQTVQAQCNKGYYDNNGICEQCQSSCLTCDDSESCTSCSNRVLNQTSGLCELCEDGKFYSDSLGVCIDCNGSCMSKCAYQTQCFDCTNGQLFDLDSMSCVDECSDDQIFINDPQLRSIDVCRSFNYYVDPDGDEIIELGTKQYPYKNIALACIEILNFHSNSERTINLYLKESTTNYISQSSCYFSNITLVNIDTYTDGNRSPENSNLFGTASDLQIFSPVTVMNLILYDTLNLSGIISSSLLTTSEKQALSKTDSNLYVHRSNLHINRVNLYRDIEADNQLQTNFVYAIYLQEKNVTITNLEMQTTGFVLYTTDPMSLFVENVYIDFHATMGGFVMRIACNYPEAFTTGVVRLDNVTVENPIERIAPFRQALIMHTGSENFTVTNSVIKIWGSLAEDRGQIEKQLDTTCNPDDDAVQLVEVTNTFWTLTYNPTQDRFVTFYTIFDTGYIRKLIVNYDGNTHEDILDSVYALNLAYNTPNTELWMRNNLFKNVSCLQGAAYTEISHLVIVENEIYQDSKDFGFDAYAFLYTDDVTMNNITFDNLNGTGTSSEYYILLSINQGGLISLNQINFLSSNIGKQIGFYVEGVSSTLSITNSVFQDLTIGSGNTLLSTGEFNTLEISNLTFINVSKETTTDEDNLMLRVDVINLDNAGESRIEGVTIQNSNAGFLSFSLITGSTSSSTNFYLSDIYYNDCNLETSTNLIEFGNLESQEDITFIISNLEFTNMTFKQQTNLIILQQQLLNPLRIIDSVFDSISSGVIYIESANKQTLQYPTKVEIVNSTFTSIAANYGSLLVVREGGDLVIQNSTFSGIYSFEKGAVISAGYQRTTTSIYDSKFLNCSAIQGAVFNIEDESVINVYGSDITNNFAVISGVVQASNNGFYRFYNSTIHGNKGLSSSVSQVFDVAGVPVIDGCSVYENDEVSQEDLEEELTGFCRNFCFLSDDFKQYLLDNPSEYDIKTTTRIFQLISANLQITNESKFYSEGSLIDSFVSTLSISNSHFYDLVTEFSAFTVTSSTLEVDSCDFYNISAVDNLALFTVTLDSTMHMTNSVFTASTVPFLGSLNSDIYLSSLSVYNITTHSVVLDFLRLKSMAIEDLNITDIFSESFNTPFSIEQTESASIKDVSIKSIQQQALEISKSNIELMSNVVIENALVGVTVTSSRISLMENTILSKLGSESTRKGGALYLVNSNATLNNVSFLNNTADQGGALFYSCLGSLKCTLDIIGCKFDSNTAIFSGGALKYDAYRPIMSSNIFKSNTAEYGNNIASYPIKIKLNNSDSDEIIFTNVGSGIKGDKKFTLILYDHDGQVMNLDSSSQIQIRNLESESDLHGTLNVKVVKGVALFEETTFISQPGTTNVEYSLSSDGLNFDILRKQYGSSYEQENIFVSFRFCKPGEIEDSGICRECSSGSYSFEWNSTHCENCMNHAECLGSTMIDVKEGYWRMSTNSTHIVECPNSDACKGGYVEGNEHPVECAAGYDGDLCSECIIYEGTKYERLTDFQCTKCPDPVLNAIRVVGVGILVLLFILGLIVFNLRKKKESQPSILMRIMANYMQVMTATMAYSMKFPDLLNSLFLPVNRLGSSGETLMSYDCFASDSQITLFAPSTPVLKTFMIAILPIILLVANVALWAVLHVIFKKWLKDYRRNVVVSMITILFLMHPTLTETALGMFQCIEIDSGEERVRIDLGMVCYSLEHISWCLFIGLPMIIFWVIGCPLLALKVLIKNRHQLDQPNVQRYFIVLYQGFRHQTYYWELVNTSRKVIIVCINVFLAAYPPFYKGASAIILILVLYRVQLNIKPYKKTPNNECENLSYLAACITLYGGLLFADEDSGRNAVIDFAAFIFIVALNCRFFLFWFFLMTKTTDKFKFMKKISNVLRILLCKKKKEVELFEPDSFASFKKKIRVRAKRTLKRKTRFHSKRKFMEDSNERQEVSTVVKKLIRGPRLQQDSFNSKSANRYSENREDNGIKRFSIQVSRAEKEENQSESTSKERQSKQPQRKKTKMSDIDLIKKQRNQDLRVIAEEDSFFNSSVRDLNSLDDFRLNTKK